MQSWSPAHQGDLATALPRTPAAPRSTGRKPSCARCVRPEPALPAAPISAPRSPSATLAQAPPTPARPGHASPTKRLLLGTQLGHHLPDRPPLTTPPEVSVTTLSPTRPQFMSQLHGLAQLRDHPGPASPSAKRASQRLCSEGCRKGPGRWPTQSTWHTVGPPPMSLPW